MLCEAKSRETRLPMCSTVPIQLTVIHRKCCCPQKSLSGKSNGVYSCLCAESILFLLSRVKHALEEMIALVLTMSLNIGCIQQGTLLNNGVGDISFILFACLDWGDTYSIEW